MTKKELLEYINGAPDDIEIFVEDTIGFYCDISAVELVKDALIDSDKDIFIIVTKERIA